MRVFQILPLISTKSLSCQVERTLLGLLDSGNLVTGQRLPSEQVLASQFGVSRATVREAIARLRADGVVSTKPGRGAAVMSKTPLTLRLESKSYLKKSDTWTYLFELWQMTEIEAAGLAAKRHTVSDLISIESAFTGITKVVCTKNQASHADMAFFQAIAVATQNPYLVDLLNLITAKLNILLEQAWQKSGRNIYNLNYAQTDNKELLNAIRLRDEEGARKIACKHLKALQKRLNIFLQDENSNELN
ncbi:FadR/GntR family transcriptional regulator [Polaromonas sp. CG_23.6]|uniref:FadR/GntR family transcriptional regulator n=1 Tax=Polaromonas sp. CG_23.6 TaxID=2760709 RepID=UPI0024741090|nr:FadR/GntR family transcriptional regulator [Polaromonas sp. CG_23.6]MDH6186860.1 GntR family transcriptional repressor for pyruvate dehydrogenase complex [Polaromonas sp. CG_23.6]